MNETKQSLIYQTKANDVDEKGIVTVAVNGIGIEDSQHDISVSGSFDQTLKEDIGRMRHFLNHDTTQLLGCLGGCREVRQPRNGVATQPQEADWP